MITLEDAILLMSDKVKSACASAEIKVALMSDDEARLSVYAPAADIQKIKDVTFMPAMDLLNKEELDIQVFVYDRDAPPLKG